MPGPFGWMSANRRMSANSLGRSKVPEDDPTTMDKLRKDRKFLCGNHIDYSVEIILITCRYFRSAWRQERQSEDDPTTMDKLRKDRKFLCGNHIDYMQIFSICLAAGKTV